MSLEESIICEVEAADSVIATGGSVVYSEAGMRHLATLGQVVYLRITEGTLVERVSKEMERGLFKKPSTTLQELYAERVALYPRWADITLDNDAPLTDEQFKLMMEQLDTHQPVRV